jgi:tetratricopeptide (TPR) repeat protein
MRISIFHEYQRNYWRAMAACLVLFFFVPGLLVSSGTKNFQELIDAGDGLYLQREDLNNAFDAIECYKEALKISPRSYEAMWRIARTAFYLSEFLKSKDDKLKVAEEGVDYARMAVKINPDGVEGHFWLGVNYTKMGELKGIVKSLFLLGPVKKAMRKVIGLNDSYEGAGAYVVLGRVYDKVPGILGGNDKKARVFLEKARDICPQNAMTLLFLAEVYWDIGEEELAIKTLEHILEMEPDKRWLPETQKKKRAAARMLKKFRQKLS